MFPKFSLLRPINWHYVRPKCPKIQFFPIISETACPIHFFHFRKVVKNGILLQNGITHDLISYRGTWKNLIKNVFKFWPFNTIFLTIFILTCWLKVCMSLWESCIGKYIFINFFTAQAVSELRAKNCDFGRKNAI